MRMHTNVCGIARRNHIAEIIRANDRTLSAVRVVQPIAAALAVHAKPFDVDVHAQHHLQHADREERDIRAATPKASTDKCEQRAGDNREEYEAQHMITIRDETPANRLRRREMTRQSADQAQNADRS
jgi:hypothetical protein